MKAWTRFALPLTALGTIGLFSAVTPACSSSNSGTPDGGTSSGGSGGEGGTQSGTYGGPPGQACVAKAGEIPNPECDDGDETACKATTCTIDPSCGDATTCLALADNSASPVKTFRMRRLIIVSPSSLANQTVQNTVVTSGVDMNEPQCAEKGTGDFSWLLSFDTANKKITTGGAPPCDKTDSATGTGNAPACDPFTQGYCFVNKTVGNLPLGPVSGAITQAADGTYSTAPGAIDVLNIPIYFQGSIITLPISYGAIEGVKFSANGNCIGKFNSQALQADCSDNYQNCSKWLTDGALTGYITLAAADGVQVKLLNETLCSVLTGKKDPTTSGCPKDASGNYTVKGDYCSTTKSAGGCQDAFWLSATFAASAVKLDTTGANQPDCAGGTAPTDAGSTTDSGGGSTDASGE